MLKRTHGVGKVPIVKRLRVSYPTQVARNRGVDGVEVEHGSRHVSLLRFSGFPNPGRPFAEIICVGRLGAGTQVVALGVCSIPLGCGVIHFAKRIVGAGRIGRSVGGAKAPDVGPHGTHRSVEGLGHEVFCVDGVGESHKARCLLKTGVHAFDLAVDLIHRSVQLLSSTVVAEVVVVSIVPIGLEPVAQRLQGKVRWRGWRCVVQVGAQHKQPFLDVAHNDVARRKEGVDTPCTIELG